MKIRMLLNVGTSERSFPHLKEGEHEVEAEVGLRLIERGWAVNLDPPVRELQAVPSSVSIQAPEVATEAAEVEVEAGEPIEQVVEKSTNEAKTNRGKRR